LQTLFGVEPQRLDVTAGFDGAGSGFGKAVSVLSNGNVVVTNPFDNFGGSGAGAA